MPHDQYEQLDIIHFLRVLRSYRKSIAVIILCTLTIAVLFAASIQKQDYASSASLLIGSAKNEILEDPPKLADFLNTLPNIHAEVGQPGNTINLTAIKATSKDAQETLQKAINPILEKHAKLYQEQTKKLNAQIKTTQTEIQENQGYMNRLAGIVARSSFSDLYQVSVLLNYTTLRSRNDDLQQKIARLQPLMTQGEETSLKKPITTQKMSSLVSIPVSILLGLCLGIIIGIICAVTRDWWKRYKILLNTP